ncbi:hypothetical protein DF186_20435, partial [Enterococcus hirae]
HITFYINNNSTPNYIYKFIPNHTFNNNNHTTNTNLLNYNTLYITHFNTNNTNK